MLKKILIIIVFMITCITGFGQNVSTLSDITADIENKRDKEVELVLRLKNVDLLFKTISFYDAQNIDLVFDIRDIYEREDVVHQLRQTHHGAWYRVKFIPRSVRSRGQLVGELVSFQFMFLEKLP